MKKSLGFAAIVASFVLGYFLGCGDELLPAADGAQRYVYEVSEANLTGAGGYVNVPVLKVGTAGNGGGDMALVGVYGNGRGQNDLWQAIFSVQLYENKVWVDTDEYPSHYYRVIVVY